MVARRAVLLGAAAVVVGVPALIRHAAQGRFAFRPIPGAEGFRWLDGGSVSRGEAALLGGLDAPPMPVNLCASLFEAQGAVRAAYFSDIRCPNCRVFERELEPLVADGTLALTRHELPVFGPVSEAGSRLILAGRMQGAEAGVRTLVERAFRPSPAYVNEVAAATGLDAQRLAVEMDGPRVARTLAISGALARRLGINGTPALVVGRTVVIGGLPEGRLRRLAALEAEAGDPCL